MERRVTVNDRIECLELETPEDLEPIEAGKEFVRPADVSGSLGACLYLGPSGERCARAAVEGGYCRRHHADPDLRSAGRNYTRVLVATVAMVIIVWPYVADLIRDLIHWLSTAQ